MPWRNPACLGLLLSLVGQAPLSAATLDLPVSTLKAEKKLHRWLNHDSTLKDTIARLQARSTAASAEPQSIPDFLAERDLKDALADDRAPSSPSNAARPMGCGDFPSCRMPVLELNLQTGEPLEPAILAMLKPWLWLAENRGQHLLLASARSNQEEAVLSMSIPGFDLADVRMNAEVRPGGGMRVSFERGLELGETYSRQRGTIDRAGK
jgi:hypothetical protein